MEKFNSMEYRDNLAKKIREASKIDRRIILDKEKYSQEYNTSERVLERLRSMKIKPEMREKVVGIPKNLSEVLSYEQISAIIAGTVKESIDLPGYRNMEAMIFKSGTKIDAPDGVYGTGWVHPRSSYIVVQNGEIISQHWLNGEDGIFVDQTKSVYDAPTWAEWTDEDEIILSSGQYGNPRIEFKLPEYKLETSIDFQEGIEVDDIGK